MTDEQRRNLEAKTRVGREVIFKNKGSSGHTIMGVVEDEVSIMVAEYKHMIQRIRFAPGVGWDGNTHAYRTGYYTYTAGMKRIVWGQYTQFLSESEYGNLLAKARAKGWNLF